MGGRVSVLGLLIGSAVGGAASAAGQVSSVGIEDAKTFLAQYAAQSYRQSPQFLDLYSDRAVVRARIAGQAAPRAFQGRLYKRWVRDALQGGKAALDASQFKDASVERRGARLVIRAKRYSANRCYWDPNYLVGIEREGARFVIVEERMTTQPQARCAESAGAPPLAGAPATLNYSSSMTMGVVPGVAQGGVPSASHFVPGGSAVVMGSSTNLQAPLIGGGLPGSRPSSVPALPVPPASMALSPSPAQPMLMQAPPVMSAEEQAAEAIGLAQALAGGASRAAPAGEGSGAVTPVRALPPAGSVGARPVAATVVVSPAQGRPGAVVVTPSQ